MFNKWLNFHYLIVKHSPYPFFLDFFKWQIIDFFETIYFKKKDELHLYGIKLFVGLYGQGKTSSMSYYLNSLRYKYGKKIYIFTNYGYKKQDDYIDPSNLLEKLTKIYDKPCVFAIDEIQNEFNSRDFKSFPKELFYILTQNRKGHGKQVLASAQDFTHVDKQFRDLCSEILQCRRLIGRWFQVFAYAATSYIEFYHQKSSKLKSIISPIYVINYIQTDRIRNSYDSYQLIKSKSSEKYLQKDTSTLEALQTLQESSALQLETVLLPTRTEGSE